MRDTWFDCEANEDTVKSVAELTGIYEMSVGRGANLLLNIGPNARGLLPEADEARLKEFGAELRRRYDRVVIRKPSASRQRSPEVYALAQGKRAQMK